MQAFLGTEPTGRGLAFGKLVADEPSRRSLAWPTRRTIARAIRLSGTLGLAIGGALWIAHALQLGPHTRPSKSALVPPAWRDIIDAAPLYRLDALDFSATPTVYTARAHAPGGGREDVLSLGSFAGKAPALRLRLFRRASEAPSRVPLFAAIVHEAAQAGLSVERSGLPEILPTRFGRFEIVDVALAGDAAGTARNCSGFRQGLDTPALSMTGLACGASAAPLPRVTLTCLLDRLDLASASGDAGLADFFARTADRMDPTCVSSRPDPESVQAQVEQASVEEAKTGKPATSRKSLRRRHDF